MRLAAPRPGHEEGLTRISREFVTDNPWAVNFPVGQMSSPETAYDKLFSPEALVVLVAENEVGEMSGYVGVYEYPEAVVLSVLIEARYRPTELMRDLIDAAFKELPGGLTVEAWVSAQDAALARKLTRGTAFARARVRRRKAGKWRSIPAAPDGTGFRIE